MILSSNGFKITAEDVSLKITPENEEEDYIITFNVTDGEFTDSETINIEVNNVNGAPKILSSS